MGDFLPKAFLQGDFVDFADAKVSVATHALHYGTGVIGGLRGQYRDGEVVLFRLDEHALRLSNSSKYLGYDISSDFVVDKIIEFVKLNKPGQDIYIRPLVYVSQLGVYPKLCDMEKDFLIYGLELGDYLSKSIRVCFSSWQRNNDNSVPLRGKISGTYINSSLSKTEAIIRGFDEALVMNSQGKVCEGSAMNLFVVRDGKLITPGTDQDILEGITRKSVIQIARDNGIEVVIRPVDKTEVLISDEVFLTGTAAKITGVSEIEQYKLPRSHPITDKIKEKYTLISSGLDSDYEHWITRLKV